MRRWCTGDRYGFSNSADTCRHWLYVLVRKTVFADTPLRLSPLIVHSLRLFVSSLWRVGYWLLSELLVPI